MLTIITHITWLAIAGMWFATGHVTKDRNLKVATGWFALYALLNILHATLGK